MDCVTFNATKVTLRENIHGGFSVLTVAISTDGSTQDTIDIHLNRRDSGLRVICDQRGHLCGGEADESRVKWEEIA